MQLLKQRVEEALINWEPRIDVLNGIAYEKKSRTLLVTGKLWPALFVLRIQKVDSTQVVKPPDF